MELTHEQKQILRHAARDALALRHPVALSARQLTNRVGMEVDFNIREVDVLAAIEFLSTAENPHIKKIEDNFGAIPCWQATPAGVLAWERETVNDRS